MLPYACSYLVCVHSTYAKLESHRFKKLPIKGVCVPIRPRLQGKTQVMLSSLHSLVSTKNTSIPCIPCIPLLNFQYIHKLQFFCAFQIRIKPYVICYNIKTPDPHVCTIIT